MNPSSSDAAQTTGSTGRCGRTSRMMISQSAGNSLPPDQATAGPKGDAAVPASAEANAGPDKSPSATQDAPLGAPGAAAAPSAAAAAPEKDPSPATPQPTYPAAQALTEPRTAAKSATASSAAPTAAESKTEAASRDLLSPRSCSPALCCSCGEAGRARACGGSCWRQWQAAPGLGQAQTSLRRSRSQRKRVPRPSKQHNRKIRAKIQSHTSLPPQRLHRLLLRRQARSKGGRSPATVRLRRVMQTADQRTIIRR